MSHPAQWDVLKDTSFTAMNYFGPTKGACLGDAVDDVDAEHDGVLLVEYAGGQDAQDAGEHRLETRRLLLLLLHLRPSAQRRNFSRISTARHEAGHRARIDCRKLRPAPVMQTPAIAPHK